MAGCGPKATENRRLRVSCAASLFEAAQATCRAEHMEVDLQSGGSNTLVRQANLGSGVDLLLLADDSLARELLVPRGFELRALASNRLVLIAPVGSSALVASGPAEEPSQWLKTLKKLREGQKLAVADPETAPLGKYTRDALQSAEQHPDTVPLQDASAVLSAVALGHAALGVVYRTDALAEPTRVTIAADLPPERHGKISYVAVLPSHPSPAAQALLDSLQNGKGREILASRGFLPVESSPQR